MREEKGIANMQNCTQNYCDNRIVSYNFAYIVLELYSG